jgi:DNA polymerase-3 subunit delta'
MSGVWDRVVGQPTVVAELQAAVADPTAMTHAWLFTGPPGSGRSVAARAFAAALQCPDGGDGTCHACRTALAGTHADVNVIVPDGLSIGVLEARELVRVAGRAPSQGRWQMIIVEDADRMSESAANAVLKMIEEPPARTVVMLCAPSLHPDDVPVTIRSRCRVVSLRTPPADAIAEVLVRHDGVDPPGRLVRRRLGRHVGRSLRQARDGGRALVRKASLDVPLALVLAGRRQQRRGRPRRRGQGGVGRGDRRARRRETERWKPAWGRRRGRGVAAASRGAGCQGAGEARSRGPPASAGTPRPGPGRPRRLLPDAWCWRGGSDRSCRWPTRPAATPRSWPADRAGGGAAAHRRRAGCRTALEQNVKPQIAVEALTVALRLPG